MLKARITTPLLILTLALPAAVFQMSSPQPVLGQHKVRVDPLPDEEGPGTQNDPSKRSDADVLRQWCISIHVPILLKWQETSWKGKGKALSCLLKVDPDGTVSDVEIYRSSGSKSVDNSAKASIKSAMPFQKFVRKLSSGQEIIVQLYKSGQMRTKQKIGDQLTLVGPVERDPEPLE